MMRFAAAFGTINANGEKGPVRPGINQFECFIITGGNHKILFSQVWFGSKFEGKLSGQICVVHLFSYF